MVKVVPWDWTNPTSLYGHDGGEVKIITVLGSRGGGWGLPIHIPPPAVQPDRRDIPIAAKITPAISLCFMDTYSIICNRVDKTSSQGFRNAHPIMQRRRISHHDCIDYYMRAISKFPLLSKDEERTLAHKSRKGDRKAEKRMIECNLRLVVKVASEFADMGVPIQDLINEGNIGLMKAVRKFDPAKGKLSTYAVWWIKQCIRRAVGKGNRTVRLPVHMHDKISKIRKVKAGMMDALGREPSNEELADETGISSEKISMMMGWGGGITSLDAPMGEPGQEISLMDMLSDESSVAPSYACEDSDMAGHVENLLKELRPREREIIRRRFGIDREAETLEEIGSDLRVTRERIRQIQADALRKMLESHKRSENRANRKKLLFPSKP